MEQILEIEHKSEDFYREHAREQEKLIRDQMELIADEEQKHAIIIHNLIRMIERPDTWVEDAEFNNLEEY